MTRRFFATAASAAAIFAAVLGAPAPADDPTPTPSATVSATPTESATAAPAATQVPTTIPTQTPTDTPTATPTETATEAPTQAPTQTQAPTETPTETTTAPPAPTGTPTATATATATATPAPKRPANVSKTKTGSAKVCIVKDTGKASTSTSTRGCVKVTTPTPKPTSVRVPKLTNSDGSPAPTNPSFSLATPGPAKVGVPDFFIDKFRIPPFLLPIYQAAGMQYGIRWEVLAGINEIETDYGRNLNVSSAGALGWMQFMPATWKQYGVDANQDGVADPFNPVDAIFTAARYLKAAGGDTDIRRAVFAYNHADWYVDSVLMRAQVVGGLPGDLVGSLTGLTQGRFPVRAKATYADALTKADRKTKRANPAVVVESKSQRKGIDIFAKAGSKVIAVNDGKVVHIGHNKRLGRYIVLQDVYGNTYTYGHLKSIPKRYPAPRPHKTAANKRSGLKADPEPEAAATKTTRADVRRKAAHPAPAATPAASTAKVRLFAHPERQKARTAGGDSQLDGSAGAPLGLDPKDFRAKRLKKGATVLGGTTIGRIGKTTRRAPHLLFEIRPAGRGAPRIDPKPILDGWKLLESTAVYRAKGKNALFGTDSEQPSIGQIMLMSKEALAQRVLADNRIQIYACGRADIRSGAIDRRVLATLEFLAESGLKPTVSALECGHSYLTTSGNVSEHTTGTAVDIAAINGIPIYGHQGPGSIADVTIQRLLTLQGTMKPHQIISLMTYPDADNTLALPDHDDHIHVGWRPLYGQNKAVKKQIDAILKPDQWIKLINRLGEIDNPTVPTDPSKYSLKDKATSGD